MAQLAIIQDLQALARKLNRTPTTSDINGAHTRGIRLSIYAVKKAFGSLTAALKAAKLPLTYKQEFTEHQLIDQLRDLSRSLGRPIVRSDILSAWKRGTCARPATFQKVFGTTGKAIQKAGVGRSKDYTRADLVKQYRALAKELGRLPGNWDIRRGARENKCAGITCFQRVGGGLRKIRMEAGLSPKTSRGVLISQLKTLAERLGRTPTARDVEAASRARETAALGTYQHHFGSYRSALKAAGFQPRDAYTRGYLMQFLRGLAHRLGRRPVERDLELVSARREGPGITAYKKRFGSFQAAIEAAGLERMPGKQKPRIRKARPRTDLLEPLRRLVTKLGRLPTLKDIDQAHARGECASQSLLWKEFGGLTAALTAAGFPALPRRQTPERLIQALQRMTRELGKVPSSRDIQKLAGKYPTVRTFERYFGSLPAARAAARVDLVLSLMGKPVAGPTDRRRKSA
ncbi:MAG TPA: hypothetical protein VEZ90_18600 [Blastocatellia bacterium]|nr:hypothetical protein [Blastocatellia bacterium]